MTKGRNLLLDATILLAALSVLTLFSPGYGLVGFAPPIADILASGALTVLASITVVSAIRFWQGGTPESLFQTAAFSALFLGLLLRIAILPAPGTAALGGGSLEPLQAPVWLWIGVNLLAAPLLLLGALTALPGRSSTRWRFLPKTALFVAFAGVAVALGAWTAIVQAADLPTLVPSPELEGVTEPADRIELDLVALPILIAQGLSATGYLAAGLIYGLSQQRTKGLAVDGPWPSEGYRLYVALGLLAAAFAQLHFAIVPGASSGMVTSAEVLSLTSHAAFALGITAAVRQDRGAVHGARIALRGAGTLEQQLGALEEREDFVRARQSILAQDLATAREPFSLLAREEQHSHLPGATLATIRRLQAAIEDAFSTVRYATIALEPQGDPTVETLLCRFVEDYGYRFGLETACDVTAEPALLAELPEVEILRISREAVNHVRAMGVTNLRVELESGGGPVRLVITGLRHGYRAAGQKNPTRIRRMREVAAAIGGRLHTDAHADSARVVLELRPPSARWASPTETGTLP